MKELKTFLVTGGGGFIGSNLIAALESRHPCRIVILDNVSMEKWRNISKRNIEAFINPNDEHAMTKIASYDFSAVFHMGAISSTNEFDVDKIIRNNLNLSQELAKLCQEKNIPFIYASSAATYGDGGMGFLDREDDEYLKQLQPLNPYGWSKHQFDRWILRRSPVNQHVGLKFFNVYGQNEYHKGEQQSVISKLFNRAINGVSAVMFRSHRDDVEDGGQKRDFIHVNDVVKVILFMYDNPHIRGLFNVGTGLARTFNDLANCVYGEVGRSPNIQYIDTPLDIRDKYQYFTQAEMSKLRAVEYRHPFITLEDGIADYVRILSSNDKWI